MASPVPSSSQRALRSGSVPHAAAARLPKRKNRISGDAERQSVPRKRSKVSEEPVTSTLDSNRAANGGLKNGDKKENQFTVARRVKRQSSNSYKPPKVEGGLVLSKTAQYTIKQVPGMPDNLRKDSTAFRAFFPAPYTKIHSAIATTSTQVFIWDYASSVQSPVPCTIKIPEPLRPHEKLPLGALLKSETGSEDGLVVASPTSGKIWYWENFRQADSLNHQFLARRRPDFREGQAKLMSGEVIESLVAVEHGGHILILSSGRLAYLGLKDSNSNAAVIVTILNSDSQVKSSWFGSLRATLGGSWKNTIAGVQTRRVSNQFETIALTEEGQLKTWDVQYDGNASSRAPLDLGPLVRDAFIETKLLTVETTPIKFLDFELLRPKEWAGLRADASSSSVDALILAAVVNDLDSHFILLHMAWNDEGAIDIKHMIPIYVFNGPTAPSPAAFELNIPEPGHTAFITMPNAVIMVSLGDLTANPRREILRTLFQDIVYLQYQQGAEIISAAPENRTHAASNTSSLLIFTKAAGAIRIIAEKPPTGRKQHELSPKAKIEQAVFYGQLASPVLDFQQSSGFQFPQSSIEEAALELSYEIITSRNPNIPDTHSNTELHIFWRQSQLKRLIEFVLQNYSPVSRATKWRLLWDAEKLEAASMLWKVYDRVLSEKSDDKVLFPLFIKAINEKGRGEADVNKGEFDPIRYWFSHDIDRVGKIIDTIDRVVINEFHYQDSGLDLILDHMAEAREVIVAVFQTAYDFRAKNLETYGLKGEEVDEGILVGGYEELLQPWTSHKAMCDNLSTYVNSSSNFLALANEEVQKKGSTINPQALSSLRAEQWKLVYLNALVHSERERWLLSRPDEEDRAAGERARDVFEREIRPAQLLQLADIGRGFDAMKIAEKLHDMDGLVQLCVVEIEYLTDPYERLRLTSSLQQQNDLKKKKLYAKLSQYFSAYGEGFAQAFFTAQIRNGRLADLLQQDFGKQKELTSFLRAKPEHWKLAWINDVTKEKDLLRAGETLLKIAQQKETNFWAQKAEISIAKLARDAAKGPRKATGDERPSRVESDEQARGYSETNFKRQKTIKDVRSKLYNHCQLTFREGLDASGAVEIAMKKWGRQAVRDRPANSQILNQGFEELVQRRVLSAEVLIDVLTLMDSVESLGRADSIHGQEFYLALQVLDATGWCEGADTSRGDMLRNLIWKRLLVRDDWLKIHHTKGKRDRDVSDKLKMTFLFGTLILGARKHAWNDKTKPAFTLPKDPAEVLYAGSDPKDLELRFSSSEIAKPIAKDNKAEDELLNDYMSRCRLAFHFEACQDLVVEELQGEVKEEAVRRDAQQEARRQLFAKESSKGLVNDLTVDDYDYGAEEEVEEEVMEEEEVLTQDQIDAMDEMEE